MISPPSHASLLQHLLVPEAPPPVHGSRTAPPRVPSLSQSPSRRPLCLTADKPLGCAQSIAPSAPGMDPVQVAGMTASSPGDGLTLRNRLGESHSPYVRGHMHNPVAWQTWGPEAIELARRSDRLLFVSIGYAACHWCHVMERESFENPDIAAMLNESFIPVKVDREERPDVDRIYMNYVQALSGQGGWPLNVFLTPHLQPIFGGTYFPGPGSTMAQPGQPDFVEILDKMRIVWQNERPRCLDSARAETKRLFEFAQDGNISRQDGADHDGIELEVLDDALGVRLPCPHPPFTRPSRTLTTDSTSSASTILSMQASATHPSFLRPRISSFS